MRLMGTQCPSMERADKRQRLIVLDRNAIRTAASGCKTGAALAAELAKASRKQSP
jgi:hypothetical protein